MYIFYICLMTSNTKKQNNPQNVHLLFERGRVPKHLLFYCDTTKDFWRAFSSWLSNQNVSLNTLTFENILFGVFNNNEDFIILNHLILLGKFFIYKCKLNKIKPTQEKMRMVS